MSEDTVRAVRELFYYPFACQARVVAHAKCLENRGWQQCEAQRESMDSCLEDGEKLRFHLQGKCSRFKRLHQMCILQGEGDCADQLMQLHACATEAATSHVRRTVPH